MLCVWLELCPPLLFCAAYRKNSARLGHQLVSMKLATLNPMMVYELGLDTGSMYGQMFDCFITWQSSAIMVQLETVSDGMVNLMVSSFALQVPNGKGQEVLWSHTR
ncbi:uncharacterized protein [Lolium perenne]|uniref:uncharacterized protein isoform X2 n=1 Tax=Lolium perenne TaxID=4522 RepID=UPI0021F5E403|nr:uncharacterized protein LOC127307146 [Lolium perenne]XP_051193811.1 uncharacterized protein LOC127307146 [Lolium perenne]